MYTTTRVQILDEIVCVSHMSKGINPVIFPSVMDK